MNHDSIITITVTLLLTSSLVSAGTITDTYTTGDPLTTTTLDNIKTEVNDNAFDITTNATNIGINTGAIASLFGGDGSAGNLTVSASVNWNSTPPANPNFANITIDVGQTLTVSAGTTIRCNGDFINNGTLNVRSNSNAGNVSISTNTIGRYISPHPGDSIWAAGTPISTKVFTVFPQTLIGGLGGRGIPQNKAVTSYTHFNYGGGGGSGHVSGTGGNSGGLVKIYCNGSISNFGVINANAPNSFQGGGGGGGIVVLASLTEVNNDAAASITANGGMGSNGEINNGIAGGGGGGIIVLAAPSITNVATNSVIGGLAGVVGFGVTNTISSGGGGGGASGGNGGSGGTVLSNGTQSSGTNGSDGYTLEILAMPLLN